MNHPEFKRLPEEDKVRDIKNILKCSIPFYFQPRIDFISISRRD